MNGMNITNSEVQGGLQRVGFATVQLNTGDTIGVYAVDPVFIPPEGITAFLSLHRIADL